MDNAYQEVPASRMRKNSAPVTLSGVRFSALSREETEQKIRDLLQQAGNARIFTPNPDMLWQAQRDSELKEILNQADLLLPDGVGVTLAARLKGTPLPALLPGIDTAEWLLSYAAEQGLSVFLLGGKPHVAQQAASRLQAKHPALVVCGTHHGYFDKTANGAENQAVLRQIRDARPDLLFVCLGVPLQEKWIAENTPTLPSLRLSMGLGGALDVWSGALRRAPALFRRTGTEWLWRTLREPRRIGPLLHAPAFLASAVAERRKS